MKIVGALGAACCAMMSVMPLGCGSSLEAARDSYRAEHPGSRLSDITVEQLQGCVEAHGDEFPDSWIRVDANVLVDPEKRIVDVETEGLPYHAPDFAACTKNALRNMALPALPLRTEETARAANEAVKPMGNEVANPVVVGEALIALGEFVAQHGGKAVLYSVTIEVLAAVAVAGATTAIRRIRKKCLDHYEKCIASNLYWDEGKHINDTRCSLCRDVCELKKGQWPDKLSNGYLCEY